MFIEALFAIGIGIYFIAISNRSEYHGPDDYDYDDDDDY